MSELPRGTRIHDPAAQKIFERMLMVAGMAVALVSKPERRGMYAYVGVRGRSGPMAFYHEPIGIVPAEKAEKYRAFAAEKPWRALENGQVTSYESRDPDNGKWGGGVVAGDWLLGVSGLPELWDEAVVVVSAVLVGLKPADWAQQIAGANGNGYIVTLLTMLGLITSDQA